MIRFRDTKNTEISSYISTIIGVSLVLFLFGIVFSLLISTEKITSAYKEKLKIDIYFFNTTEMYEIEQFIRALKIESYTKKVEFISKEKAKNIFKRELGTENFSLDNIQLDILPSSVVLYLNSRYTNDTHITNIIKNLQSSHSIIEDIRYQKDLIQMVNDNTKKISAFILSLSIVLLFITTVLINNTIRLSIHSKKLLLRTMSLVGATDSFIYKPFVKKSIIQGIISSIIASVGIFFILSFASKTYENIQEVIHIYTNIFVMCILLVIGVLICTLSTYFSVKKYLKLDLDKLF